MSEQEIPCISNLEMHDACRRGSKTLFWRCSTHIRSTLRGPFVRGRRLYSSGVAQMGVRRDEKREVLTIPCVKHGMHDPRRRDRFRCGPRCWLLGGLWHVAGDAGALGGARDLALVAAAPASLRCVTLICCVSGQFQALRTDGARGEPTRAPAFS